MTHSGHSRSFGGEITPYTGVTNEFKASLKINYISFSLRKQRSELNP